MIAALSAFLRRLFSCPATVRAVIAAAIAAGGVSADDPAFRLDLRLRAEAAKEASADADSRGRFKALGSSEWSPATGWTLDVAAGTGRRGDPREPDWIIGDGPADPLLRLQRLEVRWGPTFVRGLRISAGRLAQPLMCVQDLVYDGDWSPTGAALAWESPAGEWQWHGRLASFHLVETSDPEWRLYAGQAALEWRRAPTWRAVGGIGLHSHDDPEGRRAPLGVPSARGNSLRNGRLAEDYEVAEAFGLLAWDPWWPLTLYGQVVRNTAADRRRDGWLAGVSFGRSRAVHGIEIGWNFRRLEADATPSALADSDFGGGGTDVSGHRLYARWRVHEHAWLALAWMAASRPARGGARHDLGQVDFVVRF